MSRSFPRLTAALVVGTLIAFLAACGGSSRGDLPADLAAPPSNGDCRNLKPADLRDSINNTPVIDCAKEHTAQTFHVGRFEGTSVGTQPVDTVLAPLVYEACQSEFMDFLGANVSIAMRSTLTWVWFRPSDVGWERGARWFRCDVVGGGEQSKQLTSLPETAEGLLAGVPDDSWMACAEGPTVDGAVKLPCSEPHDWRAVSTVVLGAEKDTYPGAEEVESLTQRYCSDQVGAWLGYPVEDYEFGFTWFQQREWDAGNRRSVCWAKTKK